MDRTRAVRSRAGIFTGCQLSQVGSQLSALPEEGFRHVRGVVAYDGTDFWGFQWQAEGRTVQGVLEAALRQVTQHAVRVIGAGRTDAGVHALGQVIGFRVPWRHPLADLQRALNAVLPEDVVLLQVAPAPDGWHPRFSALRRHYRYTVVNRPVRDPLTRRYMHWVREPLDIARLQTAADLIIGEHDFASFGRPMQPGDHRAILIEVNGPGGLYLEIARTMVLGRADDHLLETFAQVKAAQDHTLSLMKPGAAPAARSSPGRCAESAMAVKAPAQKMKAISQA